MDIPQNQNPQGGFISSFRDPVNKSIRPACESEARSNDQTYSGVAGWDHIFEEVSDWIWFEYGTLVDFSTYGAEDLQSILANEVGNPNLHNLQYVDLHNPQYAAGRENSSEYVTEQTSNGHELNYQFSTPPSDEDGSSSTEPASEPTAGEGTEGEECDCACGEGLSPALTAIHTYEIWDDGGTPEFPDDDVLIGYAVTEFYGEPWGNTTIYDMDGNEVEPDENGEYPTQYNAQNSDWRLINAENFGTVVNALANGKPQVEPTEPEYQISQITNKIGEFAAKNSSGIGGGDQTYFPGANGAIGSFSQQYDKINQLTDEHISIIVDKMVELEDNSHEPVNTLTTISGLWTNSVHLNDEYFEDDPMGIPCVICHGITGRGRVGPPNSFKFPAGPAQLQYYKAVSDTTTTVGDFVAGEVAGTAAFKVAAVVGRGIGGKLPGIYKNIKNALKNVTCLNNTKNGRVVLTDTIDTAARNRIVTTDRLLSTGQWKDGDLLLNKTAIRDVANETGQSVRQVLYDTAYHEAFHGFVEKWTKPFFKKFGIDDIYLSSQDAHEWGRGWGLWYRSEEFTAE